MSNGIAIPEVTPIVPAINTEYKIRLTPRWLILFIDLNCAVISTLLAYIVRFNFELDALIHYDFRLIIGVCLAINLAFFIGFRIYSGIIRHTTAEDSGRILLTNFLVSLGYLAFSLTSHKTGIGTLMPVSVICIYFFSVNFILIGYRFWIRHLYHLFLKNKNASVDKQKAVVFNTDKYGLLAKNIINEYKDSTMMVVAFMDNMSYSEGKKLEGIPIFSLQPQNFEKLQRLGVSLLIIAKPDLDIPTLNLLVDNCLPYGIKVQQVPPVQDWIDGNLASEQLKDIKIEDLLERAPISLNTDNINAHIKGKTVLVTGAAGSIGSELVRQVMRFSPAHIILCDKAETPMHDLLMEIDERAQNSNLHSYMCDICDRERMEQIFYKHRPHMVFHAAAYKHVPLMEANPSVAVINNVQGTRTIAELAVAYNTDKFVMVSTDKAVNPTNVMGASKRIAEVYIQSYFEHLLPESGIATGHTKFITTRFGNVLGSNGSVIPRFKNQLAKGGPITVTHPEITRYFMTIPEAAQLVMEAGCMGTGGEIYVFDMGKPVKIIDLANKMIRLAGKEPGRDIRVVYTGLRPGEKLYEELLNNSELTRPTHHVKIMIADTRKYDYENVLVQVDRLMVTASRHAYTDTVQTMKDLIPEYISKNSIYEKLDLVAVDGQ